MPRPNMTQYSTGVALLSILVDPSNHTEYMFTIHKLCEANIGLNKATPELFRAALQ